MFHPLLCPLGPLFANEIYYSVDLRATKSRVLPACLEVQSEAEERQLVMSSFPYAPSRTPEMESQGSLFRRAASDVGGLQQDLRVCVLEASMLGRCSAPRVT